ncbi:MAG: hypothetical protein JWM20_730 [Patescibacteria group bacterium]|nr:hypothetical protein [Patescibacteria group bacterium]
MKISYGLALAFLIVSIATGCYYKTQEQAFPAFQILVPGFLFFLGMAFWCHGGLTCLAGIALQMISLGFFGTISAFDLGRPDGQYKTWYIVFVFSFATFMLLARIATIFIPDQWYGRKNPQS